MTTETEILKDIKRRHSTLHEIDRQCVVALGAYLKMINPAADHGLTPQLQGVRNALVVLHDAAKAKFEGGAV